ncbi:hypothetical protein B484DRAFT_439232, partial [Ochromonadaceae sp. CCMP2298]
TTPDVLDTGDIDSLQAQMDSGDDDDSHFIDDNVGASGDAAEEEGELIFRYLDENKSMKDNHELFMRSCLEISMRIQEDEMNLEQLCREYLILTVKVEAGANIDWCVFFRDLSKKMRNQIVNQMKADMLIKQARRVHTQDPRVHLPLDPSTGEPLDPSTLTHDMFRQDPLPSMIRSLKHALIQDSRDFYTQLRLVEKNQSKCINLIILRMAQSVVDIFKHQSEDCRILRRPGRKLLLANIKILSGQPQFLDRIQQSTVEEMVELAYDCKEIQFLRKGPQQFKRYAESPSAESKQDAYYKDAYTGHYNLRKGTLVDYSKSSLGSGKPSSQKRGRSRGEKGRRVKRRSSASGESGGTSGEEGGEDEEGEEDEEREEKDEDVANKVLSVDVPIMSDGIAAAAPMSSVSREGQEISGSAEDPMSFSDDKVPSIPKAYTGDCPIQQWFEGLYKCYPFSNGDLVRLQLRWDTGTCFKHP